MAPAFCPDIEDDDASTRLETCLRATRGSATKNYLELPGRLHTSAQRIGSSGEAELGGLSDVQLIVPAFSSSPPNASLLSLARAWVELNVDSYIAELGNLTIACRETLATYRAPAVVCEERVNLPKLACTTRQANTRYFCQDKGRVKSAHSVTEREFRSILKVR